MVGLGANASSAETLKPCESDTTDMVEWIDSGIGSDTSESGRSKLRVELLNPFLLPRNPFPPREFGRLGMGIGELIALISCSRA